MHTPHSVCMDIQDNLGLFTGESGKGFLCKFKEPDSSSLIRSRKVTSIEGFERYLKLVRLSEFRVSSEELFNTDVVFECHLPAFVPYFVTC